MRIYECQPTTLHAKTFVVDGEWFTVGSRNFDNRSMAINDEVTLMVLDRAGGQQMDRILPGDLRDAEEITREGFRRRSWLERLAEWGANALTRLLYYRLEDTHDSRVVRQSTIRSGTAWRRIRAYRWGTKV